MAREGIAVIGFVAPSGSGKTTLLRKLVPVLRERGLRIGYLKHAHHGFDLDVPGKDSYAIRESGAVQTLLASDERWALQTESPTKGQDPVLEEMLSRFDPDRVDLILVEGFKHAAYPKIEVHRGTLGKEPLYPEDPDILAVVTDRSLEGEHPPVLPLEDPEAIADFIQGPLGSATVPSWTLRVDLVRHYRWLRQFGCNDSHSGNASVRQGDGFWITPTGCCTDTLEPKDLLFCPLEGECPPGASSDAALHRAVYLAQPAARALLHSHGPYSVAVSFAGQDFRPADFEGGYYFESVPVVNVPYEEYLEKSPALVAEALAGSPIAMVRGHGVYAWGEALGLAYKWTTSLELSAKTYVVARQAAAL
jgi:molybdopterin-guanine dinucleotide biosynthesis protein MobB